MVSSQLGNIERFVQDYMSRYDCSHDWLHVERVRRLARDIASSINEPIDMEIVDLAALLHDVGDAKYHKPDELKNRGEMLKCLLLENNYSEIVAGKICFIVENVSFGKELDHKEKGTWQNVYGGNLELSCVQDADRLDAIGAIGIARCFAFSGASDRPFYDPSCPPNTAKKYRQSASPSVGNAIEHFYEKLLLLEGMMKTEPGQQMARRRTDFIVEFVKQFKEDCGINW